MDRLGAELTVEQPAGVGVGERVADIERDVDGVGCRERAAKLERLGERLVADSLGHDVRVPVMGDAGVEHTHDVRLSIVAARRALARKRTPTVSTSSDAPTTTSMVTGEPLFRSVPAKRVDARLPWRSDWMR
jgi:hypothetical protein